MSEEKQCPQCKMVLAPDAPQGLCPVCLLKHVLEPTWSASGGADQRKETEGASPSPTPAELAAHFPDLEILEEIGRGGMSMVYKARQKRLDRLVALKVIAPQIAQDPIYIARFQAEAKAAARLNHPNIVQIYAAGEDSGIHYLTTELVEGESLHARLERGGRMDPQEALAACVFIADGLKHAWDEAQIIHRDIKPANIFLSNKGAVKVGDLGLAKSVGGSADSGLTHSGITMGTPYYMSPEQAIAAKEIDFRADIYSLGCTLYHMLTGQTPYSGDSSMTVMMKHVNDPPPAIFKVWPACPMPLGMLVGKMLAKRPSDRHGSYDELIADLRRVYDLLGQPQPTVPVSSPQPALVVKKKASPALVYGIAAAAVIMAAGVLLWAPWKVSDEASGKGQAAGVGSASVSPLTEQKQESRETPKTPTLVEPTTETPARPPEKREQAVAAAAPSVTPAMPSPASGMTPTLPPESTSAMAKPQPEPARAQSEGKVTTTAPATVAAASAGNQPPAAVDAAAEFVKTTAALPPEQQVTRVMAKLRELNPQFDGKETHKVENGAVTELAFSTVGITDITPLKALKWLKKLSIAPPGTNQKGALSDLSPLAGLPLTGVWCQGNAISDLSPLKDMPLTTLSCGGTQVKDLAPLANMKLAVLSVNDTEVSDLAPLAGMPLTVLWCNNTKITDLSPLKAMPLQELRCDFQPERDTAVLREIGTLQKINDVAARAFWARIPAVVGRVGSPAASAINKPLLSPGGFQPLFNGRDLTGWVPMLTTGKKNDVHQPTTGGWTVQNGELICSTTRSGWLKSERQYGDFVLQLEFKLQRDGNSDALIRCHDSGSLSRMGMDIQIIDPHYFSANRVKMISEKLTGAIYGVVGPRQPTQRPIGEWNSMEIRCEGDNVEVMLNGTRTVSANMNQYPELRNRSRSGYVGFSNWQGEAKGTAFRNIRIKDLSTKPASATPSSQPQAPMPAVRPTAPGAALGQPFVTSIGMELVPIPPGEFMMGSTPEERAWAVQNGCSAQWVLHEGGAPRKTAIKQGFWLGKTEVTVGQWKQFVAATDYVTDSEKKGESQTKRGQVKGANWKDPSFGFKLKDTHPVSYISWNDAVAFCVWLNEREAKAGRLPRGFKVRLPTEAEWEHACRAGTQTKFWWGETKEGGDNRLNWGGKSDGFEFVSPVDNYVSRGRNKFGLADMLGNVWEWCLDEFDETQAHEECYKGNPGARVLRGGSFYNSPGVVRCAGRHNRAPDSPDRFFGFRVVMGVER